MRDTYINIRKEILESQKQGKPAVIDLSFFYQYYVSKFENLPKERMLMKKDRMGNIFFDQESGEAIFEPFESRMISIGEFQKTFGTSMSFYLDDILDGLDSVFNVSWLCDKNGEKIKLMA